MTETRQLADSRLIQCNNCKELYPGRITNDGKLLPQTGKCTHCGGKGFTQLILREEGEIREKWSPHRNGL